ncbi:uncharacterized protein EAE97_006259 [Botrytis byssoidea]|uniref:DUF676 domain-containing protein n=1 Tax=Botrytis byssoidea TaxID=139641 RepID=A0A9P5M6J6_9HELO|nr:uncharacterized protein EAE97_006259 [Botrytis byssoidea]KAF7942805.1 hypothetical protein EAE97_006259 [Botrytis byssoidea]
MEIHGGTDWHRDSEISMIQLRSPKTSLSTRTSTGDNEVQSQNFVPLNSAETSESVLVRLNGRPKYEIDELPFKGSPSLGDKPSTTEVDIIGVPAIGGDPEMTWMPEAKFTQGGLFSTENDRDIKSASMRMTPVSPAYSTKHFHRRKPAWIVRDIRSHKNLSKARVLLYDHGYPKEGDTLKQLATRLLDSIRKLRSFEKEHRPLFFVCHSTGGLVLKLALTDARRLRDPILHDCYGVTFFATPHRGSSYLSQPAFSGNSNITGLDQGKPFHAPITSIKSAILNLRNESVFPLVSTHTKCAAFGSANEHTKEAYLPALAALVEQACKLSKETHFELNLEHRVEVEINGFYEGSATISTNEPPIRVWSTNRSLHDFRRNGPTKLLKERREEVSTAPGTGQYLRRNARAPYLSIDKVTSDDNNIDDDTLDTDKKSKSKSELRLFKRSSSCPPESRRELNKFVTLEFMWIHVPFNNPTWVPDILERISVEKGSDVHSKMLDHEHWHSKHVRGRYQEHHHACFLKPHCSFFGLESVLPLAPPKIGIGSVDMNHVQMCLYLPYLHFDTYQALVKRRAFVKQRIKQGRSRPIPQQVSKLDSQEIQVLWQYLGHDPPINARRTLDQFAYPSLLDTSARDKGQMLYNSGDKASQRKRRKRLIRWKYIDSDDPSDSDLASDDNAEDGTVLMVDQFWLWVVDDLLSLSFLETQLQAKGILYQQGDLRDSIFNEVNGDLISRCENAYDLAALATLHAVTVLFERTSHADLEVFRIFEGAISIMAKKMFKYFQNLQLRDIEDELNILKTLFTTQMTEISKMIKSYGRMNSTENGRLYLMNAKEYLEKYTQQVERMIENLRGTRDEFDKFLAMTQTQTQVRLARLQADLADAKNRSFMIFTMEKVFTVIFLPLSFFTGLFGMNVQEWGGGDYLPLRTVGAIAIPTSPALITLAFVIAWSIRVRRVFNFIGKKLSHIYPSIYSHVNKAIDRILETEKDSGKRSRMK